MFDMIKRFVMFLLPVLRIAAIEAVTDTLYEQTYGRKPYHPIRRHRTRYADLRPRPLAMDDEESAESIRVGRVRPTVNYGPRMDLYHPQLMDETHEGWPFHDVLLVAFDISGRSAEDVHAWLQSKMPHAGVHTAGYVRDNVVYLDSWWVANDERFYESDCDSAVFVRKGEQEEARELLRKNNLVD